MTFLTFLQVCMIRRYTCLGESKFGKSQNLFLFGQGDSRFPQIRASSNFNSFQNANNCGYSAHGIGVSFETTFVQF